jgi:hypothetical protein
MPKTFKESRITTPSKRFDLRRIDINGYSVDTFVRSRGNVTP